MGEEPGPSALTPRANQQKITQQKNSLAARRAERMQANIYERNESGMNRVVSPGARGPQHPSYMEEATDSPRAAQTGPEGSVYGLAGTYDPNEGQDGGFQVMPRQQVPKYVTPAPRLDLSDIRSFLMAPGPKTGPVMCYIVRDKGSAKMYPKYNLFLEDGKRFLLAARKRKKQTTSNYLVSLDYDDLNRDSDKFFGKLRANFVGTEFTVYDSGTKTGKDGEEVTGRQELGAVAYQYNVLGTRGPRKMTGVIPAVDGSGRKLYRQASDEDNMLERCVVVDSAGLSYKPHVTHRRRPLSAGSRTAQVWMNLW